MPLDDEVTLGDRLIEVQRALLTEFYERLALAGFADIGADSTVVFKDVAPEGSVVADLAQRAQVTEAQAREAAEDLAAHGYAQFEGGVVRLTERGWAAVAAGRRALRDVEAAWAQHLWRERIAALGDVLDDLAAWHRGEPV
jgi:hypothetical protein